MVVSRRIVSNVRYIIRFGLFSEEFKYSYKLHRTFWRNRIHLRGGSHCSPPNLSAPVKGLTWAHKDSKGASQIACREAPKGVDDGGK